MSVFVRDMKVTETWRDNGTIHYEVVAFFDAEALRRAFRVVQEGNGYRILAPARDAAPPRKP